MEERKRYINRVKEKNEEENKETRGRRKND